MNEFKRKTRKIIKTVQVPQEWVPFIYRGNAHGYAGYEKTELKRVIELVGYRTVSQGRDLGYTFCPAVDLWANVVELNIWDWE